MREALQVTALPGYPDEIGRWMWAMRATRERTLRLVHGMDQATLDWEGPDGRDNAIGTLLYHIGLVEMSWLYLDILERQGLPPEVQSLFPLAMGTAREALIRALQVPLEEHLGRLARSRSVFLEAFREVTLDDWRRVRSPDDEDYDVTPEWAVYHLVEHEAGHAYQISSVKRRSARFLK